MNQGQYGQIFQEADYGFTYDKTEAELTRFLQTIHVKLGNANSQAAVGIRVDVTTDGSFIRAQYKTTFDRGLVIEAFAWKQTGDTLKLYAYDIQQIQE